MLHGRVYMLCHFKKKELKVSLVRLLLNSLFACAYVTRGRALVHVFGLVSGRIRISQNKCDTAVSVPVRWARPDAPKRRRSCSTTKLFFPIEAEHSWMVVESKLQCVHVNTGRCERAYHTWKESRCENAFKKIVLWVYMSISFIIDRFLFFLFTLKNL